MSFPICCIIGLYETNEMDMRAFVTSCDKKSNKYSFYACILLWDVVSSNKNICLRRWDEGVCLWSYR